MSAQGQLRKKAANAQGNPQIKRFYGPSKTAPKKPSFNSGKRRVCWKFYGPFQSKIEVTIDKPIVKRSILSKLNPFDRVRE